MSKWLTVKDLYEYSKDNNLKLLSNYNAPFWKEYISNYKKYDKLFLRRYSSFRYFYQDEDSIVSTLTGDFIDDVYNYLMINTKKYEELYRLHVVTDEDYYINGDINYTETMDRDKNESGSYTMGARSDSTTTTIGSKTDTSEQQVSAYNSGSYSNANKTTDTLGSRSDSESFSKGAEIDSRDIDFTDDYTLTKKGNMGGKTLSEVLKSHQKLWTNYEFYDYIFKEISAELLLV